jgi:hypothetical protein
VNDVADARTDESFCSPESPVSSCRRISTRAHHAGAPPTTILSAPQVEVRKTGVFLGYPRTGAGARNRKGEPDVGVGMARCNVTEAGRGEAIAPDEFGVMHGAARGPGAKDGVSGEKKPRLRHRVRRLLEMMHMAGRFSLSTSLRTSVGKS